MRRIGRNRESVQNRLTGETRGRTARSAAHRDRRLRVVSRMRRIAEIDRIGQRNKVKAVRLGDRLIVVDEIELAGREERRQFRSIRTDVSYRRVPKETGREAGPSI